MKDWMKTYTKLRSYWERTKLRSGMSREEIERYLDEQDELELEEMRMKKQRKYEDREEYLNSMGLESYDIQRDIEFEENCNIED